MGREACPEHSRRESRPDRKSSQENGSFFCGAKCKAIRKWGREACPEHSRRESRPDRRSSKEVGSLFF